MDEFEISASIESLHKIDDFISSRLEEAGCPMKTLMKIEIIVDEICGNIVRYSGASFIRVSFEISEEMLRFWTAEEKWDSEPGRFNVWLCDSSVDGETLEF